MSKRVENMTKNDKRMEIFKKLNESQLQSFVQDLTYNQYLLLFKSKYWTGDELRSLFASMHGYVSDGFFREMTNEQYEILFEMMTGEDDGG